MRNISSVLGKLARVVSMSLVLLFAVATLHAQDVKEGEKIFKAKCTSCHKVDRKVVGPALKGITETKSEEWLIKWIKNSQALIASGDKDAIAIFEEYNKSVMTSFTDLSDDQIKSVLAYIKAESAEKPKEEGAAGGAAAKDDNANLFMIFGLLGIVVLAIVVIVVLNRVIRTLERVIATNQAAVEAEEEPKTNKKFLAFAQGFVKNKKLVGFAVLMLVALLAVGGWKTMWNVGVHTGYQPVQPIKFSHQLHAGVNKIECQYCHGGAFKSKNASIPSANVCMNCHNTITGSEHYDGETSPEIAKIYRALDWNPETRTYGNNPKPIQWVRIHNLPDFAYFNHSQHVTVAGVECQTCHGPIETMEEVYQYSPLTMKWCVDCHKATDVKSDNKYYEDLIKAHESIKKGEKMTAAMIGGLECGKCHY
ncbi:MULTISPECIES: c-type cytochrome [Sphingobacterium]|jgi:mono/diheme cytochrome c family protein|uniref:c-type cytochrome n=1 Tax=Sphingobacterium TaxID=28453 RepID=UPI0004E5F805|nr:MULTISPECIES: c-type cytochrome [Sphingobacterium]WGQ16317.1 cytochrome c3 family protein [Sphingobacterium faecium]CDT07847.1 Cytochrome c, mono-and diheme variant [Sphingobacterium sp. PM2-P1-29]HCU45360.1 cytochrome C [Sphingobacterium sp.]